jgi:hypothetical protein
MDDYQRFYDLERYLFEDVRRKFQEEGSISAFDLLSIVIWKSNRAKTRIAKRLAARATDLETAARELTRAVADAPGAEARLSVLMRGWGFKLPMASAILAVLYPDEFTVYDTRVCGELGNFHKLANRTTNVWTGYVAYRDAVIRATPPSLSLRERDRYLWGRSAVRQLERDVRSGFADYPRVPTKGASRGPAKPAN